MKKIAVILLSVVLFSACTTSSLMVGEKSQITKEKVAKIEQGKSDKNSLHGLFGEPEMEIPTSEGSYHFYKDLSLHSLWVVFDSDGTVESFRWAE